MQGEEEGDMDSSSESIFPLILCPAPHSLHLQCPIGKFHGFQWENWDYVG